jgi:hypothetical protein
MLLLAVVIFLPESFLLGPVVVLAVSARGILPTQWMSDGSPWHVTVGLTAIAACAAGAVGHVLDLPGAAMAGTVGAIAAMRQDHRTSRRTALAVASGATALWVAVHVAPVRFDYYRFVAGDLSERGLLAASLDAYETAKRYAPGGESRRDLIDAMRDRLERDGTGSVLARQ